MNWLLNIDYQFFNVINSLVGDWQFLDWFGIFCAKYLIFVILFIVLIWWWLQHKTRPSKNWPIEGKRKWLMFGNLFLPVVISLLANQLFALLIKFRERPLINLSLNKLINTPITEKSFPSDHTAVALALAFAIFCFNKKIGSILIVLAFLVGVGRIFVGVHYPLDVVGGIVSAGIAVGSVRMFFRKYQNG